MLRSGRRWGSRIVTHQGTLSGSTPPERGAPARLPCLSASVCPSAGRRRGGRETMPLSVWPWPEIFTRPPIRSIVLPAFLTTRKRAPRFAGDASQLRLDGISRVAISEVVASRLTAVRASLGNEVACLFYDFEVHLRVLSRDGLGANAVRIWVRDDNCCCFLSLAHRYEEVSIRGFGASPLAGKT